MLTATRGSNLIWWQNRTGLELPDSLTGASYDAPIRPAIEMWPNEQHKKYVASE